MSLSYTRTGRKNGYRAAVCYNSLSELFYFCLENKTAEVVYNSAWDKGYFKTESECLEACEKYIDSQSCYKKTVDSRTDRK